MCAPATHAPDMRYVCVSCEGGQGPCGGIRYIYMYFYTDQ